MEKPLVFILADGADLPDDRTDWQTLQQAQRRGIVGGTALRLYRVPPDRVIELEELPLDGKLPGARDRQSAGTQIICDAIIPHLDVKSLWLGVYACVEGETADSAAPFRLVDRFALREAENETCWFYPTETGHYLAWESERALELMPGTPVEAEPVSTATDYQRSDVHVLWSLMADDEALTCVGLTYRRRRIDWGPRSCEAEPCATWSSFAVDVMADPSFRALSSHTLFGSQGIG
jgi:hypothetical protein